MIARPLALLVTFSVPTLALQEAEPSPSMAPELSPVVAHSSFTTEAGLRIDYRVTAGTVPLLDEDGSELASIFHTTYVRAGVEDTSARPLVFSFNGGPGSASVWMHMAYTGPRVLNIDDEGYPVQPYGVQNNPYSILDVADIVYVDPVNTGFSRIEGGADRELFFGVNEDVAYLARWISAYVSRLGRWASPKYLIGESYGTTRVSGLARELQGSHWMYLNGVILVSPTGLGIEREGPVEAALPLPYYAAAAWYHGVLEEPLQSLDLDELLPQVERFTLDELIPALARGGALSMDERQAIAARCSRYSGLSAQAFLDHSLAVPTSFFWKELLRGKGLTVGRLDSRYRGLEVEDAGERPDFDPALTSWNHSFTPAINHYLRDVLGIETELEYWIFGPVHPWNREGNETGAGLARAMAENPFLHVLVQAGYYDGATDYFSAKYTMWNMDPSGRFQDRMEFKGYRSGHMMYLRREDLKASNDDIRSFLVRTLPDPGEPARR